MCFNIVEGKRRKPSCCSIFSIDDARRVADKLSIRHYMLNMQKALEERVVKDFCAQYLLGRTPNPCIICNQYLKFGELLKKADVLGAQFLATGHYARAVKSKGVFWLYKAKDSRKDQSYFLYRLNQKQLGHVLFPLGQYSKDEVRKLARKFSLPVAEKPASQEICFLPQDNYREFLKKKIGENIIPGEILDQDGNSVGRHQGIVYYTIGQREGLGIAKGYPVYITQINRKKNTITIGRKEDVLSSKFIAKDLYFIYNPIKNKVALKVKIRYNHKESEAKLIPACNKIRIEFKKPQFAVTPGQAAVFYNKNRVIGGGTIDRVLA
jgi:tRNA-specific 2-thiouridylase